MTWHEVGVVCAILLLILGVVFGVPAFFEWRYHRRLQRELDNWRKHGRQPQSSKGRMSSNAKSLVVIVILLAVSAYGVFKVYHITMRLLGKSADVQAWSDSSAKPPVTPSSVATPVVPHTIFEANAWMVAHGLESLFINGYSNITYLTNIHRLVAVKNGASSEFVFTP